MKRVFSILLAVALVLAFSLVVATPVAAATLTVDTSLPNVPPNYHTLQAAITAANPGDTIEVAAGTYNVDAESWQAWGTCIHINVENLHIKGAGSGSTVLDARHTYSVLNGPGPTQAHCTVVWVQAQTCTIEGLTVKRGDYGIRANWNGPSTSLTLIDVVVDGNYGNGIVFENDITTATFTNVVAQNSGDRGIYFSSNADATAVTLTNTSCNNNGHAGFGCQGSIANLSITGGTFNNNTGGLFTDTYGHTLGPYYGFGIELWNCVGSISGVTASGNGFGGPDIIVGPQYGLEGGAGIAVEGGSTLANNIIITGSSLVNNRNGLWIQDPDSVTNWGGCTWWFGTVAVHLSNIAGNTEFGVLNCLAGCAPPLPGATMSATCNWWNHASGPSNIGPGTGDKVSQLVTFSPWLAESYALQRSVTPTTGGGTAYFSSDKGNIVGLTAVAPPAGAPAGVTFPYGMFSFQVCCISTGATVTLAVTLPGPVPVGTKWYKYNAGSWDPMDIGDDNGDNVITVMLTDGASPDDEDSIAGQITDQGGPGYPGAGGAVGWETYPVSKVRVLLPWIALLAAIVAGTSLLVLRRRRITT